MGRRPSSWRPRPRVVSGHFGPKAEHHSIRVMAAAAAHVSIAPTVRIRRVIRERAPAKHNGDSAAEFVELAPGELSGVFAAPSWLRDLGMMFDTARIEG